MERSPQSSLYVQKQKRAVVREVLTSYTCGLGLLFFTGIMLSLKETPVPGKGLRLSALQVVELGMKWIDQVVLSKGKNGARYPKNRRALLVEPSSANVSGRVPVGKCVPLLGEVLLFNLLKVLDRIEPERDEHVVATADHLITSQPREFFEDRNTRMLARVSDLGTFVVPAAACLQAAFAAERLAQVAFLFQSPDREHRRSTPMKNRT